MVQRLSHGRHVVGPGVPELVEVVSIAGRLLQLQLQKLTPFPVKALARHPARNERLEAFNRQRTIRLAAALELELGNGASIEQILDSSQRAQRRRCVPGLNLRLTLRLERANPSLKISSSAGMATPPPSGIGIGTQPGESASWGRPLETL